ncbi:DNA/RNA non-specific endonuclease [Streptomyces sp. NPDC102278]|uniref:DNA/RNA non-specific endonuclease n=1 Tax=Streptomyces sp. NPDC102278 TaxID=3366152 RepID=UPI0038102DF3
MHRTRHRGALRVRARSTVLILVAAVTLALTTTDAAMAQPAAQQSEQPTRTSPAASPAAVASGVVPKKSEEHCEVTKAGSPERRRGAVRACASITSSSSSSSSSPRLAAAQPLAAGSCTVSGVGNYAYSRFTYCVSGLNVLYILRDANGVEIGRGNLEVTTSASLPASGTAWTEQVTVKMTDAQRDVTSLSAKFRAACGAGCKVTKAAPWFTGNLTLGQSLSGTVTYSSTPAQSATAQFDTSYAMYVTMPGATITDPNASWTNPRPIRCDDAVGGTSTAGCAIPSEMPVVAMNATSSDPGGAIAAYGWAQNNLNDGWGKSKPLTRQVSGVADRTSRTCGSAGTEPFKANTDLVATDTCGEFPFAEMKEGGIDGARCVEVIPNASSGGWDTYVLGNSLELDRAAPCVRAHVPAVDKQFADGKLAAGFQSQRIIDADQFRLEITTPAGAPQASCLANHPLGAIPSGTGWYENTTEPVAHVNKTITPIGPAGTRPTKATACLGKTPGTGKPASGSPTGWKDAQKFRDDFSPGTKQARCHLIANILGGPGQIEDGGQKNLVPCWQVGMNTGTPSMRTFEFEAQEEVKKDSFGPNDAILYQATPVFRDATSTIPTGVTMTATIERANGTAEELFPNVYVPNTFKNTGTLNLGN